MLIITRIHSLRYVRSEHILGGYPDTGGYVYGERCRRHVSGVYMVNINLQVETYTNFDDFR
jgi:hypothetical protein